MTPLQFRRGDIFMADLNPVIGSEQGGIRPVLIIQNNTGNRFSPTVIVATITTKKRADQPTHVYLGREFGLPEHSLLSTEQPRTLDKSRLQAYVGHVDNATMRRVDHALKVSMDLLQNEPYRITLCGSCASAFYGSSSHHIRRVDRYQAEKSRCSYCNSRSGYDYWLTNQKRSKPKKHSAS